MIARYWSHISLAVSLALLAMAWAGWNAEKALRQADRAAYAQAQTEAAILAQRAIEAAETRYKDKANAANEKSALAVSAAVAATADYASRMRVKAPSCGTSASPTAAESGGARVPEAVSAYPYVAITDADLQACSVNTATLLQAREWALSISK